MRNAVNDLNPGVTVVRIRVSVVLKDIVSIQELFVSQAIEVH